jgi:hypothetical protein
MAASSAVDLEASLSLSLSLCVCVCEEETVSDYWIQSRTECGGLTSNVSFLGGKKETKQESKLTRQMCKLQKKVGGTDKESKDTETKHWGMDFNLWPWDFINVVKKSDHSLSKVHDKILLDHCPPSTPPASLLFCLCLESQIHFYFLVQIPFTINFFINSLYYLNILLN